MRHNHFLDHLENQVPCVLRVCSPKCTGQGVFTMETRLSRADLECTFHCEKVHLHKICIGVLTGQSSSGGRLGSEL